MSRFKDKPPVDLDMLTMALQSGDLDTGWWLDTHTGEVIPEPDPKGNMQDRSLLELRQSQPDRYIDIEPLPTSVVQDLMESFIPTLDDHAFCSGLKKALSKKQPVWHFKAALAEDPVHEDSWYAFKEQFFALQARQWARELGLEFEVRNLPEAEHNDFAGSLITEPGGTTELLSLTVPCTDGQRRYVVWRSAGDPFEITLTASEGAEYASEQVIGETMIDAAQMDGMNHVLAQLETSVETDVPVSQPGKVELHLNKGASRLHMVSQATAGSVPDQLQTLFDFLLGLSRAD